MNTLESSPLEHTKPAEQIADTLSQFLSFRDKLRSEKADLLKRVAEIDHALGANGTAPIRSVARPARSQDKAPPRHKNKLSLREAVAKLTEHGPLSRDEILAKLPSVGYYFVKAKDHRGTLNALLGAKKNRIKRIGSGSAAKFQA